jgi:hypothetical protein
MFTVSTLFFKFIRPMLSGQSKVDCFMQWEADDCCEEGGKKV